MDETWIHHYIPESNRSSAEWREAGESRSKRVKASRWAASQEDTAAVEALLANDGQNMNMERHHLDPDLEAEELNPGGQETLLENNDHVHNVGIPRIAIAPGEGQRPLDVILDVDAEELAFPSIYAGIKRQSSETFTTIVRSELRNVDRRGCRTDKLFFNYKKLELIKIRNNISTCLRKRSASSAITAANVLNEEFMGNLICHDEGYRDLRDIRSSPAHWEEEKKKVMAIIRQFGLPTFFITLSVAETKWTELLVLLKRNVDRIEISEETASAMQFTEKARLIRTDPVTCARYFDYRYREVLKLMKKPGGVFGLNYVEKYYWRVEFQLKDAPTVDFNNDESIQNAIAFIDQSISTDIHVSEKCEDSPYAGSVFHFPLCLIQIF
ncbi:hypothetical protein ACLKA7_007631 [Drosophila subpalustris]